MDSETVASLLGDVSVRTLTNWCNLGMPFEKRGRERVFNWPAVLEWYVAFKSGGVPTEALDDSEDDADEPAPGKKENITQASLRKIKAEADLKQLTLARLRGQVIGIDDARRILDRLFGNLKSALLNAAPLLNTQLEGEPDMAARETAIREFMESTCRELATGKIVRDSAETAAPDDTATDEDTIDSLSAAADITDQQVDAAVIEYLAAVAAHAEATRAA